MKTLFFVLSFIVFYKVHAQSTDTAHLYNPNADAEKDIAAAVKKAKQNTNL